MKQTKKNTKRILQALFLLPILSFTFLFSIACTACDPPFSRLGHLVSELRDNIFIGTSDSFSVSIITGRREDPFIMDGVVGETRDFTLITLTPLTDTCGNFSFEVTIGGTQFKGDFLAHPFSNTISAEIQARALQTEIALTIKCSSGTQESLFAKSVLTEQMICAEEALKIAENKLRYSLETIKVNGELQAEIYIRLMANPIDNSGGYHWYVAFVASRDIIFAVLIEPISMQVVAIRN